MTFTLINARPSPFGRKVAIALIEKGLEYDVRYDVPWGPDTVTPEFSPIQQLPILIAEDGETVYDSVYILEWLEARYPTPALLPTAVDARLAAKKRQMLAERVMEAAQSLVFELHRPDPSAPWADRQRRKVEGGMSELERLYAERAGQADVSLDLGDIAMVTTLTVLDFGLASGLIPKTAAVGWRGRYPALERTVETLERRPSFARTAPAMMDVDLQATVA
jgi:glutathione S-transferase